jgi:hypothetical protein
MSYLDKFILLKEKVNSANVNEVNEIELLKVYSSFYCILESETDKEILINEALSIIQNMNLNLIEVIKYCLDKNIIIKSKKMRVFNWIFIGENVVRRELVLKQVKDDFELVESTTYPSVFYMDINKV